MRILLIERTLLTLDKIWHLSLCVAAIAKQEAINLANIDRIDISGLKTFYEEKKAGQLLSVQLIEVPNFK